MKRITWEEWITNTTAYGIINTGTVMYPVEIGTGLMLSYMIPSNIVSARTPAFMKWWLEDCTKEDVEKIRLMLSLGGPLIYEIS